MPPEQLARLLYDAAVAAVQPARLFDAPDLLKDVAATRGRIRVIATGKAAAGMWHTFARRLDGPIAEALVVVPHGYVVEAPGAARVLHAGHPVPDAGSARAAEAALALARRCHADDALVVLLSGGASALLGAPRTGLTSEDLRETTAALLGCGAPIEGINAVRGLLTRASGGRLAAACRAPVFTFSLSDVPGDLPAVIGGGPTVASPAAVDEARAVLDAYGLRTRLPTTVTACLARAQAPPARTRADAYTLVGSNRQALEAAAREARRHGATPCFAGEPLTGEAREAGQRLARMLATLTPGTVLLAGGETTVTLGAAPGHGGRNQEAALAAALALDATGTPGVLLCAGTDGRDGPTEAAGAWVDAHTVRRARAAGLDPVAALAAHDANPVLAAAHALVSPGPTGTNVMDVAFAVAPGPYQA